jgi:hypothetical protein
LPFRQAVNLVHLNSRSYVRPASSISHEQPSIHRRCEPLGRAKNWPEPHGSLATRFQTSHSRRCEWRPRQCHPDRSEPQRRYPIAAARRCHCADRGYDSEPHRRKLRQRGIEPVIAKRRTEHGSGLGNFAGWSSALTHGSTTFVVFAFALSVAPTFTKSIPQTRLLPRLLEHRAVFLKRSLIRS